MACNPNWQNCKNAASMGLPCVLKGHDERTQAQRIDDDHDMALEMEAGPEECNHCGGPKNECDCNYDLSVIAAEAANAEIMERPRGEIEVREGE